MKYVLDAGKMQTREEAHEYLKDIFGLPDYYGKNLDALYDCLNDMQDIQVEIQSLNEDNTYALRVVKVMQAANVKVNIA